MSQAAPGIQLCCDECDCRDSSNERELLVSEMRRFADPSRDLGLLAVRAAGAAVAASADAAACAARCMCSVELLCGPGRCRHGTARIAPGSTSSSSPAGTFTGRTPGDAGEPPHIVWTLPAGMTAGPLQFPAPKRLPLGPLMDFGYENEVLFPFYA